eukprot:3677543-Pyramimonas_sp.AAC.1
MLYADVVDHPLKNSPAWLRCQQRLQAIAMIADVHGHSWAPMQRRGFGRHDADWQAPRRFLSTFGTEYAQRT